MQYWQEFLLLVLTLLIWQIFYPGLFSPDSIAQYQQARGGYFNDWHPPLMSIVLWAIMKFGGDVGFLTFLQCLAAIFGLRQFIAILIFFLSERNISKVSCKTIATVAVLIFLIPCLTPLMFFTIIFWKDAWLAIMFLWITTYLLWLFLNLNELSSGKFIIHLGLLTLLSASTILVRHNAFVTLPIISIGLTYLSFQKFGKVGLSVFLIPFLAAIILNPITVYLFDIKPVFLGNEVLASDLVIMLKLYPELEPELPLTARHKHSPILFGIDVGLTWDESTEGTRCPAISCELDMPVVCYGTASNTKYIDGRNCFMPIGTDNKALKQEYINIITSHPLKFVFTKLYLFCWMIHPNSWNNQKVVYEIYENPFNLKLNENFKNIRTKFNELSLETGNNWYLMWISGIHSIWILLNLIFVIYYILKIAITRSYKNIFNLIIYLIPLSYYLSYILAAVAQDYRFMFPATLLMQSIFFCVMINSLVKIFRKPEIS